MQEKNDISHRLKEERARIGMRQEEFAALAGVGRNTVGQWEKGINYPNAAVLQSAADAGFDIGYIITGKRNKLSGPAPVPSDESDAVLIPLIAAVGSMGPGNDLHTDDVILGNVPVSRHWVALNLPRSRPEALRLVHAYGDSMADTLNSGDFALVDTDYTVPDVDGVYVLSANQQLFIKRVTRRMDGQLEVSSDNPKVRTVDVLNGTYQVHICGRVVYGWNGRRF
ncbi:S24 family peptidase [Delftia acidovorans]|jgi:transcriptional regulator with XRE-family HTH domain|uniref:XRE family transcriptional regulator n=1 Tax=Delftia acidovorans TaxID=80866 RepID=UPI0028E9AF49|nr:S24 family peptidase [Delftia acidovorans]